MDSISTIYHPVSTSTPPTAICSLYEDIDRLINDYLSPTGRSNEKRMNTVAFIREVTLKSITDGYVIEVGSSLLKTYLPESDLDLILLCPHSKYSNNNYNNNTNVDGSNDNFNRKSNSQSKSSVSRNEMQRLTSIFNSWCEEISDKEEGISSSSSSSSSSGSSSGSDMMMTIRNIEFVNARTKLAHCLVNNISIDITVNQIGSVITITFLEEVDRFIGYNHLFKRSLILIKVCILFGHIDISLSCR
jgi:DNA polymerase sigma